MDFFEHFLFTASSLNHTVFCYIEKLENVKKTTHTQNSCKTRMLPTIQFLATVQPERELRVEIRNEALALRKQAELASDTVYQRNGRV